MLLSLPSMPLPFSYERKLYAPSVRYSPLIPASFQMCVVSYFRILFRPLIYTTKPNVRRAIESHLLDSSPQVRDAAVELIGKYMIESPIVADEYYPRISERVAVSYIL